MNTEPKALTAGDTTDTDGEPTETENAVEVIDIPATISALRTELSREGYSDERIDEIVDVLTAEVNHTETIIDRFTELLGGTVSHVGRGAKIVTVKVPVSASRKLRTPLMRANLRRKARRAIRRAEIAQAYNRMAKETEAEHPWFDPELIEPNPNGTPKPNPSGTPKRATKTTN